MKISIETHQGPQTELEERDQHSKREHEIRRRAYEIHLELGHNMAATSRIGFRPNASSRQRSAAQDGSTLFPALEEA
jgi:hypothetical protein